MPGRCRRGRGSGLAVAAPLLHEGADPADCVCGKAAACEGGAHRVGVYRRERLCDIECDSDHDLAFAPSLLDLADKAADRLVDAAALATPEVLVRQKPMSLSKAIRRYAFGSA